ncbi:MAG TPA: hypothetical protein VNQ77_02980 [Frankiaceae bacterium]|nr:hypothetical protein [Frankiaceae bacterium]
MNHVRALAAVVALLAAYVLLRAAAAPEPYATLARPAFSAPPAPLPLEPSPPPSRRDPPSPAAVRAVLVALDAARTRGYASPPGADPDRWAARSCACHAEDVRRLRSLAARGLALRGHRARLVSFVLVRAGPAVAEVAMTDRTAAYAAVDARGRTVARWPASGPRRWRMTLVRTAGRWLLGDIE